MCTVTFIPVGDKFFITSNRDEQQARPTAIPPALYQLRTGLALFPKDSNAGGSWFTIHENGHAVILLNGGWQKHLPAPPYRKSRGLVLLDLADRDSPASAFEEIDLDNIEPFTIVSWQGEELYECRWDGKEKYSSTLNPALPHIWSSVTLYDEATIRKRARWFSEWLARNPEPGQEEILLFHQFTGDGDRRNDLLMNRNDQVLTVSITSAAFADNQVFVKYIDLVRQQSTLTGIELNKAIFSK